MSDPFALTEDDYGADEFDATLSEVRFESGMYSFQAIGQWTYDQPRAKNDGTLSLGRPAYIAVAKNDAGFVASDDGTNFTHPDGKKPSPQSEYQWWLRQIYDAAGNGDREQGTKVISERGTIVGIHGHWVMRGMPYKFTNDAGEKVEGAKREIPCLETLLDGGTGTAATFDLDQLRLAGMTDEMEDALRAAANNGPPSGFLAQAVTVPGVNDNKAVVGALADPAFYQALRT
jgi:hypothetical protein